MVKGTGFKLEYYLWNTVFSTLLFFAWYFWGMVPGFIYLGWPALPPIQPMALDGVKFLWIFLDSWVTGIVGSMLARWAARYWRTKWSGKFFFRNFLISLVYAAELWLGITALFFDEFDLVRFLVILLCLKLFNFAVAELISSAVNQKAARGLTG